MKKILCVGHSAYDITYLLSDFPKENQKYKAEDRMMTGGGPSGNAAYLLAKYGEEVSYITSLGLDEYARIILEEFQKVGVDTKHILQDAKFTTPCSLILANRQNGSRTIINYRNQNVIEDISLNYETSPEIILFDGHEMEFAKKVLQEFPNAIKVLDAGTYKESTKFLGAIVDYLVCSEDFAKAYCKRDVILEEDFAQVLDELKKLNSNQIIVTLGERGVILEKEGKVQHFKAFPAKAIDTTGAGDIFHGAFVYGLSQGFSLEQNIVFSSACAALSVEKIGGRTSIPELAEVYEKIKEYRG